MLITTEEKIKRGQSLIEILMLRKDSNSSACYKTMWGTKTALGIYETVKRIIEEGLE